jgi:hypothetical protein
LQAQNWPAPVVIGIIELIAVLVMADRRKVGTVAPLIDKMTGLSSDARCNTPCRFDLIKILGTVAMPAYSHLLDEERDQIASMRAAGHSICAIAGALQRAKSTISRELRRNGGRYSPIRKIRR